MLNESLLQKGLIDPNEMLDQIGKLQSEKRLIDFMKTGWHALEPGCPFVAGWSVEAICEHLQAVTDGQIRRLLINVPPGFTKSMATSVFYPAYEWGPRNMPHNRYILAAHEQNLAIRDNVRSRDLMLSEWYQRHWGNRVALKGDVNSKIYYENMETGWRMASSVNSGLTGYRGDRLILDDPHSIKKADSDVDREKVLRWFSETLPTRLNKAAESAIIVIMQRVHERDVSGLILAEELGYEHLMLPMEYEPDRASYTSVKPSYVVAPSKVLVTWDVETKSWRPLTEEQVEEGLTLDDDEVEARYKVDIREDDGDLLWPERFPDHTVEELKKTLRSWGGTYAEAGQLQQRPAPRGGGMFAKDAWEYVDHAPQGGRTCRGWDLAGTAKKKNSRAAFTVGLQMRLVDSKIYIMDVDRRQLSPSGVEKMIKTNANLDGHGVMQDFPQDPGQAGKAQKAAIAKLLHGFTFTFSTESGDKEARAEPLAAQQEVGNVYLVKGDWTNAFVNEGALFPNGQFKDQIDAASRAYFCLLRKRRRMIGKAPRIIEE